MNTKVIKNEEIQYLINSIENHEVVAFPTDTVFGIACSPKYEDAVEKMKWVKGRDGEKPFPIMVSNKDQIDDIAYVTKSAKKIIENFMPGAITIIVNKKDVITDYVTNGKQTIAIRMPDDATVLKILETTGPLLVTSANLSGLKAGHTTNEVLAQLDGRISCILEGISKIEIASTIVDCTGDELIIVREGPITIKDLNECIKNS